MILDAFDQEVLDASGKAKNLIRHFYGADISQNNAEKQLAGIRRHLRTKQRMPQPQPSDLEEIEVKADGTRTTKRMIMLSEADKQDPVAILEKMGLDPLQWQMVSHKMSRKFWNVITKDKGGESHKNTAHAYMCTITVKPIQQRVTTDLVRQVLEDITPSPPTDIKYTQARGYLLELPIMDLHLALLSWEKETGENYDLDIAEQLYKQVITKIIARVKAYGLHIEQVLFPIGQDFFNSDTINNTTTKGTILDSDTRWPRMYKRGVELLVWAIEQLRRLAPVKVFHIPGNHDEMLSYCAVVTLESYFRDLHSVEIDTSPAPRKYEQFGLCGIGFAHGADEGKRIKNLFQVEQPEMWGATKFREFHVGHTHHEYAIEDGGITIRHIGTIKMRDAWEVKHGFMGAIHRAQAFVWDREEGKIMTIDVLGTPIEPKENTSEQE